MSSATTIGVPTESEWYDIAEAAYAELSPRDDPDRIAVHSVDVIDDSTCTALVNPPGGAGAFDGFESVDVDGEIVSLSETGERPGIGEQRVEVCIGF